MREDWRKRAKNEQLLRGEGLDLSVGLTPLYGPEIGPVVRCPWCGLVMVVSGNDICLCPECGILG